MIICGDSLVELKKLPENSVDSCVTDPPYGLSFMGKKWDYDVPTVELWKEVLRVLKPGGYLLSFAGTRTQHRMAVNIEDAGFEIRDMIAWIYGCLSEDTEILTKDGWKLYHKNILSDSVLCYNIDNDTYEYNQPTKKYWYRNEHTAYSIKSDTTDQIVSRNHRVIVERNGRKEFVYAETLERQEGIPVLESLSSLPDTIYDVQQRASTTKQDLLNRVCEQDDRQSQQWEEADKTEVSSMQADVLSNEPNQEQAKNKLLKYMQRLLTWQRVGYTRLQGQSQLDTRERTSTQATNDGRNKSKLEGWSYLSQPQRQIRRASDKIRQMSRGLFSYGEDRRLCYGTPTISSYADATTTYESRVRTSHQSRRNGQQNTEPNAIRNQRGTQAIRVGSSHSTTLATVTPIEYSGHVWCVEVPTGAFVARRNGKVFITGNSGFPKSHNIGKAVDRLQGNDREDMGENNNQRLNKPDTDVYEAGIRGKEARLTKGTSPHEGLGTALKPALEPITVARKPFKGNVANNVLEWGTGGINIDGSRVGTEIMPAVEIKQSYGNGSDNHFGGGKPRGKATTTQEATGRFPANLIHDGSDEVVGLFPDVKGSIGRANRKSAGDYNATNYKVGVVTETEFKDSGSAARFFKEIKDEPNLSKESQQKIANDISPEAITNLKAYADKANRFKYQPKASKSERNKGLEGFEAKIATQRMNASTERYEEGREPTPRAEQSKSQNTHPTVKPVKLMQYLVKLVTPVGGTCLDPFSGSGTTGIACKLEGFEYIGIELDKDYVAISNARIKAWEQDNQQSLI